MNADQQLAESDIVFAQKSFDSLIRFTQSRDSRLGLDGAHAERFEPLQVFVRDVPERRPRVAYRLRSTIQRGLNPFLSAAPPPARMGEWHDEAGFGAGLDLDGEVEVLAPQLAKRFRGAVKLKRVQKLGASESGDGQDFIGATGEPQQIGGPGA